MGVPLNYPFVDGIFPNKNNPLLGYHHFRKPRYVHILVCILFKVADVKHGGFLNGGYPLIAGLSGKIPFNWMMKNYG